MAAPVAADAFAEPGAALPAVASAAAPLTGAEAGPPGRVVAPGVRVARPDPPPATGGVDPAKPLVRPGGVVAPAPGVPAGLQARAGPAGAGAAPAPVAAAPPLAAAPPAEVPPLGPAVREAPDWPVVPGPAGDHADADPRAGEVTPGAFVPVAAPGVDGAADPPVGAPEVAPHRGRPGVAASSGVTAPRAPVRGPAALGLPAPDRPRSVPGAPVAPAPPVDPAAPAPPVAPVAPVAPAPPVDPVAPVAAAVPVPVPVEGTAPSVDRIDRRVRAGASVRIPGTWYGALPCSAVRPSGPTADTGPPRSERREAPGAPVGVDGRATESAPPADVDGRAAASAPPAGVTGAEPAPPALEARPAPALGVAPRPGPVPAPFPGAPARPAGAAVPRGGVAVPLSSGRSPSPWAASRAASSSRSCRRVSGVPGVLMTVDLRTDGVSRCTGPRRPAPGTTPADPPGLGPARRWRRSTAPGSPTG